ncbi:MAG: TIGR00341 family protein [Nanohaloarchaea archaeon]|nr:TIGR00341 family protein [Candidatus Nanohaloarchaea archaeon]
MKRIEVTIPKKNEQDVLEVLEDRDHTATVIEAEKDGEDIVRCEFVQDSAEVDEVIQDLKDIKEIDSGDLTVELIEQKAYVEKGKRRKGGSSSISANEMYSKAFDFSSFDVKSWSLIGLASAIAVMGLAAENLIVVIGAMVIAPMLGPFMSSSFGLVIGDRKIIRQSMVYGAGSILMAVIFSAIISLPFNIETNSLISLIADPGFTTVPLSLFVGSASAVAFSTEARETLAGVAVAIALVPPSAVAGIAISALNFDLMFHVSLVILSNVMALILAGSVTFKLLGVSPATYYRKKVSKDKMRKAVAVSGISLVLIGGIVGFLSYQDLQESRQVETVQKNLDERFGQRLLSSDVEGNSDSLEVTSVVVESSVNSTELEESLESNTGVEVDLNFYTVS